MFSRHFVLSWYLTYNLYMKLFCHSMCFMLWYLNMGTSVMLLYRFSWSCKFMGYQIPWGAEKGRKMRWQHSTLIWPVPLVVLHLWWMVALPVWTLILFTPILQSFMEALVKLVLWAWRDCRILEILASWTVPSSA